MSKHQHMRQHMKKNNGSSMAYTGMDQHTAYNQQIQAQASAQASKMLHPDVDKGWGKELPRTAMKSIESRIGGE